MNFSRILSIYLYRLFSCEYFNKMRKITNMYILHRKGNLIFIWTMKYIDTRHIFQHQKRIVCFMNIDIVQNPVFFFEIYEYIFLKYFSFLKINFLSFRNSNTLYFLNFSVFM